MDIGAGLLDGVQAAAVRAAAQLDAGGHQPTGAVRHATHHEGCPGTHRMIYIISSQEIGICFPKPNTHIAQNLQIEAQSLRIKMAEVQTDIAEVQQETGACMEHLERLDCLKTKLHVAKQGLQESDGWGRLTSELDDLLEQGDLGNSRGKLVALHKSLSAQIGLAGQSEREAQVEGFKNRMEALASPGVVESFTLGDIG